MKIKILAAAMAAAAVLGSSGAVSAHTTDGHVAPAGATHTTMAYQPIAPIRVADSRTGHGANTIGANRDTVIDTVTAKVAEAAGVAESDVGAVVMNVTAVNPADAGYLTVWPADAERPNASSVNMMHAGHTAANLVTSPVDAKGRIRVFASAASDVIVDVQGVYVTSDGSRAGRLTLTKTPQRVFDSRDGHGKLDAGSTLTVDLTKQVGGDATAAVVNITVTDTDGPGHITVHPAGKSRPNASNLNYTGAGQTVANQVYATLNGGKLAIYTLAGTHVIVDLVGHYTGANAASSTDGLFVAVTPYRVLDTRTGNAPAGNQNRHLDAGHTMHVSVSGRGGVPGANVAAVATNVTITATHGPGWTRAWPSGATKPSTSTVNSFHAGQTVANHATTGVTTTGIAFEASVGMHIIADITGYFTGTTAVGNPADGHTGSYKMLWQGDDGTYPRWNACAPIRYQVDPQRMSATQRETLDEAIRHAERATGIDFEYAGETRYTPDMRMSELPAEGVNVVFSVEARTSPLWSDGASGRGGSIPVKTATSDWVYLKGFAALSTEVEFRPAALALWMHEIGHLLGLDHVNDATQVMHPTPHMHSSYQSGDLAGLYQLGAKNGCADYGDLFDQLPWLR